MPIDTILESSKRTYIAEQLNDIHLLGKPQT